VVIPKHVIKHAIRHAILGLPVTGTISSISPRGDRSGDPQPLGARL